MEQSVDALSLKNVQLGFVYILLSNFKRQMSYLFFSETLSQKNDKQIQYFEMKNKMANRVFLYNLLFSLCDTFSYCVVNIKQIV